MVEALVDSYREIVLNGIPMKVTGAVSDANLSVFGGKVVTGDYTKDSNPLLSSWVISDLSGGHGVEDMNEGVDINRYKIGTFYTRYPGQISKMHKVNSVAHDASWGLGRKWFLGDLPVSGTWQALVAVPAGGATVIRRLSSPATAIGSFPGASIPVGSSVMFKGLAADTWLLTPYEGFTRVSNNAYAFAAQSADATHPAAVAFVVWDNKLIAIDNVGQLWYCTDPTGAWTSYGATAKLPQGDTPKSLVRYFDRQGMPAVFIISDRAVWQFDPNSPEIFSVDVEFPVHPNHGRASCRWSGDLYFSVGMGVHRYTGGSLSSIGLDRDHGLPEEYSSAVAFRGAKIVDMIPGYNSLFALVSGPETGSMVLDGISTGAYSSLHEYTGTGWHMLWQKQDGQLESASDTATSRSLGISQHEGNYRLYWAYGGPVSTSKLYYIDLPANFANPRQRARQSTGQFESSSSTTQFLQTAIFDAGMQGYNKLASAVDFTIPNLETGATLYVDYRTSNFQSVILWDTLGTITSEGTTSLPFGALANGIYPGIIFDKIQLWFRLGDSTNNPFIMESAVLSYLPLKPSSYSWTCDIDLNSGHGGLSPQDIIDALEAIIVAGLMVPFVLRGVTYRVFLSQIQGSVETGADETGYRRISLLQIPQTLGAG